MHIDRGSNQNKEKRAETPKTKKKTTILTNSVQCAKTISA